MKKNTVLIFLIIIFICLILCTKSYCADTGTVRMEVKNGTTAWTNIKVSDSYDACENLNSASSTLGTSNLQAHLTTDSDWSTMTLFSVSQYGATKSNNPGWTNGNISGVKVTTNNYTQTTGIFNDASKTNDTWVSFFDENGNPKKYVKTWSTDWSQNNFVAFTTTKNWFGTETQFMRSNTSFPISVRYGMFQVNMGYEWWNGWFDSGQAYTNTTFRPVIWN